MQIAIKTRISSVFALALLLFSFTLSATTYPINSADDLDDLTLAPGDTVLWANGTYANQEINFIRSFGTAVAPIVLKAETPGGVIFTGESTMNLYGTHLVVEGFYWREGIGENNHVQFRRSGSNEDLCTDCIIRDCAFDNLFTEAPDKSRWVVLYGQRNVVENCTFQNKNSTGVAILVELSYQGETTADHVIRNNYFYNITPKDDFASNQGDSETIRIGSSSEQAVNARVTVEHNYFQATDGENEIISNKSAGNRYLRNTFRASRGSLVLRHGARARVEGNFFLGEGKSKSGGIRITDRDHVVVNNFFTGLNNLGDQWNNAITIVAGNATSGGNSNGYQQVDDILIAFNTIYNADDPIFFNDRDNNVSSGTIAYNLVYSTDGQLVAGDFANTGAGMTYEGNIFGGSPVGITNAGITVGDETFAADGELFVPVTGGLVDGAAGAVYTDLVELDVRGLTRPAVGRDVGAHEVSGATGTAVNQPIVNNDVGNGVGASYLSADGHSGVAQSLSVTPTNLFAASGGSQTINVSGNVDWEATADEDWISLSPSTGSNSGVVEVTVSANSSGGERAGTVTVAGMGLSREIEVVQEVALTPANCPQGTNIAIEGAVIAFSTQQNEDNAATNVIDESNSNRWSAEGYPQFLVIDLGAAFSINTVSLIPHQERDYQFLLEGSNDADDNFVTLVDATDNASGGSSIDRSFAEQTYRYVKLTVTGAATYDGPWVSIGELKVGCSGTAVSTRNPVTAAAAAAILLRPVPATNVLYVEDVPREYTNYVLRDLTGRTILTGRLTGEGLDLSSVQASGMLLLSVTGTGVPVLTRKVVVQR
ncbi:chondroitinase-B domain-containing protein [Neolewinella persica]|uniref:chondroitinase-B domain-containing protein n=1 Tax=Neolewinella persica TaxID=70998 RepID=UPI000363B506|nr:chondroitinase-B domain-containing protein [Neolewinella persica]